MRKLILKDAFDLAKIMKKANLEKELLRLFELGNSGISPERLGMEGMTKLIFGCAESGVDEDIFLLLGKIAEKDPEEIACMSIDGAMDMFKQIAKENDLAGFFKSAAGFTR